MSIPVLRICSPTGERHDESGGKNSWNRWSASTRVTTCSLVSFSGARSGFIPANSRNLTAVLSPILWKCVVMNRLSVFSSLSLTILFNASTSTP